MNLLNQYKAYIKKENLFQLKDKLLIAVSGGIDSVVLCDLCSKAGYDFEIAHCNFQLRGAGSERDEKFVLALGEKYGVTVFQKKFETKEIAKSTKKSIEETARDLRYEWFQELIGNKQLATGNKQLATGNKQLATGNKELAIAHWILTAHHADDNIETLLMNFFRGTGIRGLHGILPKQGRLIRPLLFARKTELEAYAAANNLAFVTDHTNAENEFTRNYFRNTIIPLVSERYPATGENLLKNIQRLGDAGILYQQAIEMHKKKLLEPKGNEVYIPVLKLAKTIPLATVVYEIISDYGFTSHQTADVMGLLQSDSGKYIQSTTHRIIKNRKWLIISPNATTAAGLIVIDNELDPVIFSAGKIEMKKLSIINYKLSTDNDIAQLDASHISFPLLLRKWNQGDYFYPLGMQKKKKLSRFFIDQKLSLTQKENVWVIESAKKIIWVLGMRIDDRYKITGKTSTALLIQWQPAK